MIDSMEKITQTLRNALKEIEGIAATDKQVLLQQAQKAQQDLAYAQFRVQELQRARDDLIIQKNEEAARADSLERQVVALKTSGPHLRYSNHRKLLVKIAEVAGDQDPENAVDADFDPWGTLNGIAQDKQRLRDRGDVANQRADEAKKTIQRLQVERTDTAARNLKTWEEAQQALKATRTAQKERDAAVLSRAAAERQVADIKAEWDLVRVEVDKLREWKRSLPQSHWFIERQRLQDKVGEQAAHLATAHKDLAAMITQRDALQTEVTKARVDAAQQRPRYEDTSRALKEQNDQLAQAILGIYRAHHDHCPNPLNVGAAWREAWQALSAAGVPTPDDAVPVTQETAKAPGTKRASRSTRAKKSKV